MEQIDAELSIIWLVTYLGQFFAVFLFLKLLPVPIDLDVFLVGLDDLVLNFVGSLFFGLLLASAAVLVQLLRVRLDLDEHLLSLPSDLLNLACNKKDNPSTICCNEKRISRRLTLATDRGCSTHLLHLRSWHRRGWALWRSPALASCPCLTFEYILTNCFGSSSVR